ncbi:hypothetical protein [Desertibacillus haloalkaliphilus]|uniref:hypothetical protein n=1 Tax=Desertibacillus haloalkaliphilus TaxID=1328930 RepID=UPI001C25A6F9|nr:hypothetical protein [Desertibacillus haloalkaliphilus]MBU8906173.1 hypothetical protein [Desertibacillus haloalkaliphilus]
MATDKHSQNKIKYSLWDTRTDEKQKKMIEKSPLTNDVPIHSFKNQNNTTETD